MSGHEIIYGRNPVFELLRAGRRPAHRIWAVEGAAREPWLAGREVLTARPADLTARCGSDAHQGICAEAGPYPYAGVQELLAAERPVIVALDGIQDPQNLGAIARSAECAGATGLVIGRHRSAEVTAAACKASAGAVEHLRVARVRNIADFLLDARAADCWSYGATMDGRPYTDVDYSGGAVLVLGAEGTGLRRRVRDCCDELVSIPLRGRIESLNVSAAAAVLLYGVTAAG